MAVEDISSLPPGVKSRFERYCSRRSEWECWPWLGYRNQQGYGTISFHHPGTGRFGKVGVISAHRYALIASGRPVVSGMNVLHSCDNPACCNPAHLRWGTQAENCADIVARERQPKGEAKVQAKLTDAIVREIRKSPASHAALATKYGVAPCTIGFIRQRKKWAHVE